MLGVQQSLLLHNQHRTHFARLSIPAGVQVGKPDSPLSTRQVQNLGPKFRLLQQIIG